MNPDDFDTQSLPKFYTYLRNQGNALVRNAASDEDLEFHKLRINGLFLLADIIEAGIAATEPTDE